MSNAYVPPVAAILSRHCDRSLFPSPPPLFLPFFVWLIVVLGTQACDQPHPTLVRSVIASCARGDLDGARAPMAQLWDMGYAASDIMGTLIATAKRIDMDEALRLELVKVRMMPLVTCPSPSSVFLTTSRSLVFLCVGRCHVVAAAGVVAKWRRRRA